MRIATFNLENLGGDEVTEAELRARLPILRPQLQRLQADILCLQEVNAEKVDGVRALDALDHLLADGLYRDFHRAHSVRPETGRPADRHNLVILSRWPIEAQAQVRHDLVPPPQWTPVTASPRSTEAEAQPFERPLLHAVVRLPSGVPLHVLDVHLRAPLAVPVRGQKMTGGVWQSQAGWAEGFLLAALRRAAQALEARLLIDRIFAAEPAALVVAAGDFNCEERQTPIRIVAGEIDDTGNGALADESLVPLERSIPESQRWSLIHRGRHAMFDHILVSRTLLGHYRDIEVHNETLGDEALAERSIEGAPESYHAPLVAEFADP
ncbi:MAG: endonuclease/exonuclease/phosphatase family protein [Hyphomicrobiales bacterium]